MPLGVLSGCQVLDTLLPVVCVLHRCLLEFLIPCADGLCFGVSVVSAGD